MRKTVDSTCSAGSTFLSEVWKEQLFAPQELLLLTTFFSSLVSLSITTQVREGKKKTDVYLLQKILNLHLHLL